MRDWREKLKDGRTHHVILEYRGAQLVAAVVDGKIAYTAPRNSASPAVDPPGHIRRF